MKLVMHIIYWKKGRTEHTDAELILLRSDATTKYTVTTKDFPCQRFSCDILWCIIQYQQVEIE